MSIKRTNSQAHVFTKHISDPAQRTSKDSKPLRATSSNSQMLDINGAQLKQSPKLIESSKRKRPVPPDKLKQIRHVFNTIGHLQSMPVERLADAFVALEHDPRQDIRYQDFLAEHELSEASSGLLDFEHFALLVLEYEEKLRLEEEAIRRLDLKIAFECFDINKDGMIDINELTAIMNILDLSISDQEAQGMMDFADHDRDSLLSFDEFLTVLTQISAIHPSSNQ